MYVTSGQPWTSQLCCISTIQKCEMLVSVPTVKNQCVQRTWTVSWTYSWWSKISTNCCTWNLCEQWNYLYIKWPRIFCVNSGKLSRLPQLGKGSFFDAPFVDCGSTEFEVLQVDLKKTFFHPSRIQSARGPLPGLHFRFHGLRCFILLCWWLCCCGTKPWGMSGAAR